MNASYSYILVELRGFFFPLLDIHIGTQVGTSSLKSRLENSWSGALASLPWSGMGSRHDFHQHVSQLCRSHRCKTTPRIV